MPAASPWPNTTRPHGTAPRSIAADTVEEFGRVDIVVNNATAGAINDLWNFTEEEWDRTVGVNLKGYFAMIRAAAPHLCRQGSGAIVNTSSGSGFGHPAMIAYATAKEGVVGLTRTVALRARAFRRALQRHPAFRHRRVHHGVLHETVAPDAADAAHDGRRCRVEISPPNFDPEQFPPRKISPFVVWLCTDAASRT